MTDSLLYCSHLLLLYAFSQQNIGSISLIGDKKNTVHVLTNIHLNSCLPRYTCSDIPYHYNDVIMTTIASQITSLTVVYSTVYSDADQRKHQSSASLAFVWGIHRDRWIPRTKGQLRGKCFHLMMSSCEKFYIFMDTDSFLFITADIGMWRRQ